MTGEDAHYINIKVRVPGKKTVVILGAAVLAVVLIVATIYFAVAARNANLTSPVKRDALDLVARVGQIMELPKNETPTVATVTDKSKLSNQTFFKQAENGDRILVYAGVHKAILFRPSSGKIIDVGQVKMNATVQPGSSLPQLAP